MVKNYIQYMVNQINKNPNISVAYNKTATAEDILNFNADKVVLATGGTPTIPPIPGAKDNPRVAPAIEYMIGNYIARGNVVVIGAGLVGTEAALDIQDKGGHAVLIESLGGIAPKHNYDIRFHFFSFSAKLLAV